MCVCWKHTQLRVALAVEYGSPQLGWNAFSFRKSMVLFSFSGRREKELAVPGAALAAKPGWGAADGIKIHPEAERVCPCQKRMTASHASPAPASQRQ